MITTLEGKISEKIADYVVLDCAGVGYGIYVPFEDFGALEKDSITKLYIHESIRENAHDLFGFITSGQANFVFEVDNHPLGGFAADTFGLRYKLDVASGDGLADVAQASHT